MKATRGVLERGYFLVFTGWHSILLPIKYKKKKFHMMQVKNILLFFCQGTEYSIVTCHLHVHAVFQTE